ncbi:MAG: hypothetical protein H6729_13595 [Deltaproteobacteria bacterium]|nr:hypothetical protein [Deltaproteobacteria bacterium]
MRFIDLTGKRVNLNQLRAQSLKFKPAGMDQHVSMLRAYYSDCSAGLTLRRLEDLGMGVAGNRRPLEVGLMRWVIDQLAVAYSTPPNRWLVNSNGKRLAESNGNVRAMKQTLATSRYDLAWRMADRMRTLCGQAVLRFFAVDERSSVQVRVFTPDAVHRIPSSGIGDTMDCDEAFALDLSSGCEVWEREGAEWVCVWTDQNGRMLPPNKQPFAASGYVVPYERLPVQVVYDGLSNGEAWVPPKATRLAAVESVNVLLNEALVLVQKQAHASRFVTGARTDDVPAAAGPGVTTVLENVEARVFDLSPNPAIADVVSFARESIRTFLRSEGLPADSFEASARVLTGSALKAQMRELSERRRLASVLAKEDERQAWQRFVSVQSLHADAWGQTELADLDLEVDLGAFDLPTDSREVIDVAARELALGVASKVDVVCRTRNVSREQALQILEQVKADDELFGTSEVAPTLAQDGPKTAMPDPLTETHDSVIDAVNSTQSEVK